MTTHFSIDIETMGTTPNSAILSIGAVVFDPHSTEMPVERTDDTFYTRVDLAGCMALGLTVDAPTIKWWMQQDDAARGEVMKPGSSLATSLLALSNWMACRQDSLLDRRLWCHGPSFDAVLLENAYRVCQLKAPWKYNEARDTRTIYEAAGIDFKAFPRCGVFHNALDDAITQAKAVQAAYQTLRGGAVGDTDVYNLDIKHHWQSPNNVDGAQQASV